MRVVYVKDGTDGSGNPTYTTYTVDNNGKLTIKDTNVLVQAKPSNVTAYNSYTDLEAAITMGDYSFFEVGDNQNYQELAFNTYNGGTSSENSGWTKEGNKWVYRDADGTITKQSAQLPSTGGMKGDGYRTNNYMVRGQISQVNKAIEFFLMNGRYPTESEIGGIGSDKEYDNIIGDLDKWLSNSNIDPVEYQNSFTAGEGIPTPAPTDQQPIQGAEGLDPEAIDPMLSAKNAYYDDLYSMKPGSEGKVMYDRLAQAYGRQNQNNAILADAQYQQGAMQQAAVVKQITDQVRAERMARLKAGMSEQQIANQDMQMMMANVNALNQQQQMVNQQRLESQLNKNMSQDQAYAEYLDQANQRGQVAVASYAADSGNPYWNVVQNMKTKYGSDPTKWTIKQWEQEQYKVTGLQDQIDKD